jgi:hypothetical protein
METPTGNEMSEQEEFEFRARLEAEAAANDQRPMAQRIAEDVGEAAVNPFFASGAGALGAMVLGPPLEAGYEAAVGRAEPNLDAAPRAAEAGSPGQRWASKTGYGSGPGESVRDVREHYVKEHAPIGSGKISKKVSRATPLTVQDAIERERQMALEAQARSRARTTMERLPPPVQATGRGVGAALEHTPKWARRGVAGANLGYQAADAYNRALAGDVPGAVTSGAGALGSAMFMLPGKYKKAAGAGMAVGSHLLNQAMDNARENPEGYAKGKAVKGGLEQLLKFSKRPAHEATDEVKKLSDVAQEHVGKFYVPTQADRMGGVGGPSYSANQLLHPEYEGLAWGSGQPATATGLANLARDPRFGGPEGQLFAPLLGAENMHQSNQMVFNALADEFYKRHKNLTPEMRKAINDYMQTGGTISGKKAGFEGYPGFDIADPEMIRELGKTFEARKQIAQHAFGGQGLGGRKAQIIPYEEILRKTRDPLTEGAETFSMGPRAFKLTGEVHPTPRPDLNPAYPFQLHGSDIGAAYTPVPSELSLMDFQRDWRQATGKTMPLKSGKLPQPGYYEHTMGYTPAGSSQRVYPRQQITEDWIKELQRSGFKRGGLAHLAAGGEAFKNLVKAYKLFRTKPDDPETLYPLFVNANKPVPVGEWLQAEVGPVASSGKVKSKLGELAYRPGWHAGDLPLATHIGAKSDPKLRAPDLRPPNQVWAEVDMPADIDWQSIANQRAQRNKSGLIIPRTAHITDEIPFGGHYRYKTSPNMEGNWLISGDMRVNRVLSDEEVRAINEASGMYDLPRYSPLKRASGGLANVEEIEEPELK